METKNPNFNFTITTLIEDLSAILGHKGFTIDALCSGRPGRLLMADKKPVVPGFTIDEFIDLNLSGKYRLFSAAEVIRMADFCKLSLPLTISLALKSQWEQLYHLIMVSEGKGSNFGSLLKNTKLAEENLASFKPDRAGITDLLDEQEDNYIGFYIQELLETKIFLGNPELVNARYPGQCITEEMMLFSVPDAEKEEYLRLKETWEFKCNESKKKLLLRDQEKAMNERNNRDRYNCVFGSLEIDLCKWSFRAEKYRKVLELKTQFPEKSIRELVLLALESLSEEKQKMNEIKRNVKQALSCIANYGSGGSPKSVMDQEDVLAYERKIKKRLHEIEKLIHDRKKYPDGSPLPDEKKDLLRNLWDEYDSLKKKSPISFLHFQLGFKYPDISDLKNIVEKACGILEISPDTLDFEDRLLFLIKTGKPVTKIIDYLRQEIELIQNQMVSMDLTWSQFTSLEYGLRLSLALQNIPSHTDKLERKIEGFKEQVKNYRALLKNRIKEKVS